MVVGWRVALVLIWGMLVGGCGGAGECPEGCRHVVQRGLDVAHHSPVDPSDSLRYVLLENGFKRERVTVALDGRRIFSSSLTTNDVVGTTGVVLVLQGSSLLGIQELHGERTNFTNTGDPAISFRNITITVDDCSHTVAWQEEFHLLYVDYYPCFKLTFANEWVGYL